MQPEQIYHLLEEQPFRPMRVHLQDGRVYDITSRQLAVVGVNYLDIGIQAADLAEGIAESVVSVDPADVLRVEPAPAPAEPRP
jgi:hypothetical protein